MRTYKGYGVTEFSISDSDYKKLRSNFTPHRERTFKGYGNVEYSMPESDYQKLRRNIINNARNNPANWTDKKLEEANRAREDQIKAKTQTIDDWKFKQQLAQRTARTLEISIKHMQQQAFNTEKSSMTREVDTKISSASRSILFNIQNEINRIMKLDDKYNTSKRPVDLIAAMNMLTSDIQKAFDKFKQRYIDYMIPAVQEAIDEYSEQVLNSALYCNNVIGPISDADSMRIISGCYRELADGTLKPNQIDRYITNKWDTASSINR